MRAGVTILAAHFSPIVAFIVQVVPMIMELASSFTTTIIFSIGRVTGTTIINAINTVYVIVFSAGKVN